MEVTVYAAQAKKETPVDLGANQGGTGQKASGARLGNPRNIAAAGETERAVQISDADEFVAGLIPVVQAIRGAGATTLDAITRALNNDRGIRFAGVQ